MRENTAWLGACRIELEETPSTNDYVKQNVHTLMHGAVVTANRQTAGKGRLGRAWQSAPGEGLALSVLLMPPTVYHTQLLPLVCALAVKSAIKTLCGAQAGIKWPNDIVLNGKKICGILCEGVLLGQTAYAVCGMGLNLLQKAEDFEREGLAHAASLLTETGGVYSPRQAVDALLPALERYYDRLLAQGFAPLLEEYRRACITLGRDVRVLSGGTECDGRAVGISASGALLVEFSHGSQPPVVREINAGEASVRGLYGYI